MPLKHVLSSVSLSDILYHFDQVFTHLVNFDQKNSERNRKNQKKNILGEQFFLAVMHD